jgi:radical SAM superfamily enzyme YgiQ (UPF0313 family)
MRILLVKPPARLGTILGLQAFQRLEPLELGYLAAVVPPQHEVRILDLRLVRHPWWHFRRALRAFSPDLLGLTAYTHEASLALELARWAHRERPRLRIVIGGHHATVTPADFDDEAVSAVVRGEGCGPFRTLVERAARVPRSGRSTPTRRRYPPPAAICGRRAPIARCGPASGGAPGNLSSHASPRCVLPGAAACSAPSAWCPSSRAGVTGRGR